MATIDRARTLRVWTRRDLAREAQVEEGTLCDLFGGRRRPTFETLRAIFVALEIPLDDVIAFAPTALHSPAVVASCSGRETLRVLASGLGPVIPISAGGGFDPRHEMFGHGPPGSWKGFP